MISKSKPEKFHKSWVTVNNLPPFAYVTLPRRKVRLQTQKDEVALQVIEAEIICLLASLSAFPSTCGLIFKGLFKEVQCFLLSIVCQEPCNTDGL